MQVSSPFEIVLFGGLGDLVLRKLLPALYMLQRDGHLHLGKILVLTRQKLSDDAFIEKVHRAICQQVPLEYQDEQHWQAFWLCFSASVWMSARVRIFLS